MKVIVFDTETTGLPERGAEIGSNTTRWPHIIQLSYIGFDTEKKEITDYVDHIIRLGDEVVITPESVAIHKITRERSQRDGISIKEALCAFMESINDADLIVAHNISFDANMIEIECIRNNLENILMRNGEFVPRFCTMQKSIQLCQITNPIKKYADLGRYKWPTLSELHRKLFQCESKGTHNAIVDVMICLRCYVQIQHNYDIANDVDVKLIFRTLFSAYCI